MFLDSIGFVTWNSQTPDSIRTLIILNMHGPNYVITYKLGSNQQYYKFASLITNNKHRNKDYIGYKNNFSVRFIMGNYY